MELGQNVAYCPKTDNSKLYLNKLSSCGNQVI